MAPRIPSGFAQANFVLGLTNDPEDMVVTLGMSTISGIPSAMVDLANDLKDMFVTCWGTELNSQYKIKKVVMYGGTAGVPNVYESTNGETSMSNTSAPLPQNCAYLIRKIGTLPGRKNRGRMFIPGALEPVVGPNGLLDGGSQVGIQAKITAWAQQMVAHPEVGSLMILHTPPPGSGVVTDPTEISQLVLDSRIATQRRRLR